MIKVKEEINENAKTILMSEMKPLQVGIIVDTRYPKYHLDYVMRTASTEQFEVIDLSRGREGACWTDSSHDTYIDIKVKLLGEDKKLVFEISNDNQKER